MEGIKGGRAPGKKKKQSLLVRLLAFLATLALVLGAVFLVAYRDTFNVDAVKRYFVYRDLLHSDGGQVESFPLVVGASRSFAGVDGDLLVCSSTGVQLYSSSGTAYVDRTIEMARPTAASAGKVALAYDVGGQQLFAYENREEVFSLTLDAGLSLLSARLNGNGWLAVAAQENRYRGAVTLYDAGYDPVMKVYLSERFVMDAVPAPDNSGVAVLTIGVDEWGFDSRIDFYRRDRSVEDDSPDASCSLGNNTVVDLLWTEDGLWALGESAVCLVSPEGVLAGSYSYGGRYLKRFSLDGDGTAVLLLSRYRAGGNMELVVVDGSGQARASLALDGQINDISAAGRYIAVLTADRLEIYTQDLKLYDMLEGTQGARQVLQRRDGTALLIGSNTVRLYIP